MGCEASVPVAPPGGGAPIAAGGGPASGPSIGGPSRPGAGGVDPVPVPVSGNGGGDGGEPYPKAKAGTPAQLNVTPDGQDDGKASVPGLSTSYIFLVSLSTLLK